MSELIPFSQIDEDDEDAGWTEGQIEAANFLSKMDWEGGVDGLMSYGGAEYFPEEVYDVAVEYERAHDALRRAIDEWAAARGVEY